MNLPSDLKYSRNDEWVRIEGEVATLGITDYAQRQLSDIVYAEVSVSPGQTVRAGDTVATLESVKAAADVYAPVSGTVLEVNSGLGKAPEIINRDPHGAAWMVRLRLGDVAQASALMDGPAYDAYCKERSGG